MKPFLLLAAGIVFITCACSSVKVKYDFDKGADFSSLRTYEWIAKPDTQNVSPAKKRRRVFLDQLIRNAASKELAAKGFRVDPGNPDFLVIYHIDIKDQLNASDWGYSHSGDWSYWGLSGQDVDVQQYREGVLIIDMVDAASKQLIWRGFAQKALPEKMPPPEEVEKKVDKLVAAILEKFPPQTVK